MPKDKDAKEQSTPEANAVQIELDRLRAELAKSQADLATAQQAEAAAKASRRVFTMKVGEKGGISVYGLGRFPVTLYVEQWNTLLSNADAIRAFAKDNAAKLKTRD